MIRPVRLASTLVALFVLHLVDVSAGPASVLAPCPPAANQPSGAMCGQVKVPEGRGTKGGREIALNVVVLPARSAAGHADPLFAIAGGPGIAASKLPATYPRLYDALQADHDIVLVDQRGTGASHPLFCTPIDVASAPARVFDEWPDAKALTACRDRLAKDADLAQYGTAAAVEDLEAVRQALGYQTISILAVSYGTRVALEYVRRHGPPVRALALSGVVAPSVKSGLSSAENGERALRKLFEMCAADASCSAAFPKLAADLEAALATLDKGPVTASIPLGDSRPPLKVTMTRPVFARELFQLLHSREDWTALPLAIHHAGTGDFMPFAGLSLEREANRNQPADGMALSVLCSQDVPSFTPAAIAATRATFMRSDRVDFLKRACGLWPHGAPDAAATAPVRSSVPALLVSGALDPITPPAYGAEVAKTLPNGLHVVVANAAHVPANPCVNGLIVAFLKAGSTKGLDAGCAANLPALKFVTALPTTP